MKKITFLLILFLAFSITAQEAEDNAEESNQAQPEKTEATAQGTEEEAPAEAAQPKTVEEIQEKQTTEPEKVTMTKEEIQKMVQTMVNEELEKRDAAKKAEEEKKVAEEEKKEKKKAIRKRDGLIEPTYLKSTVTFILGDDNLRDDSMYSPAMDIGQRYEYENFGQRVYGYTNNIKSSTKMSLLYENDGFIENLTTRAALNFKIAAKMIGIDDEVRTSVYESGSFLEIDYRHPSTNRFKLTFYPYSADSIAIGFFRALRWGSGIDSYPQKAGNTLVPGFQALYGYGDLSVYFGFKTHAQASVDKLSGELVPMETTYAYYGGLSYNNKDLGLRGHLQGAIIDKGDNVNIHDPILADPDDDTIISYGINAFAEYVWGSEFGDPLGISSYTNGAWIVPDYSTKLAFRARAEYMFQDERLENADYMSVQSQGNIEPITDNFQAHGAMVELGFRFRWIRAMFSYTYRDLPFMVFDAPGVEPFKTIASEADQSPEHTFVLNTDFNIRNFWIGLSYGFKIPATYTVYDTNGQKNVTVIKERLSSDAITTAFDRTREVLPAGESALNIQYVRADLKYRFGEGLAAMLQYTFTQDHNRSLITEEIGSDGKGTGKNITDWDKEEVKNIHGIMFLVEGRF